MMLAMNLIRLTVFAVCVVSALVALGSWAVRTRRLDPQGSLGRFIQRFTDPPIRPIEHWLLRRGGNPQNAGWWLLGITIVGGILVVTLAQWLLAQIAFFTSAGAAGPRAVLRLVAYYAIKIVSFALIARVIGSWFGVGRFNRWMRPAYLLTDWIVEPLRKVIPPLGMIDVTPIVAWLLLQYVVLRIVMGIL